MRLYVAIVAACTIAGCGLQTPQCTDQQVLTQVRQLAVTTFEEALSRVNPRANAVLSRVNIALASVSVTAHDKGIDKYTCSAELRVKLPPQIAELRDHPVFRAVAIPKLKVKFQGNDLVAPVTYTVYRSRENQELILSVEGLDVPAKYIQGAYRAGAFDSDLRTLPDLHAGLVLYNAGERHLLIRPTVEGRLEFHFTHDNPMCRAWSQSITEQRGTTLIYDNPVVGCSVTFSMLGELLLVEHKGCDLMAQGCLPDGAYRKQ